MNMTFTEAKVFAGDEEVFGEEEGLNGRLETLKELILHTGLKTVFGEMASLVQLPLSPFPKIERCLGLREDGSFMQVEDGYAQIGYDFKVRGSKTDCLFKDVDIE